MNFPVVFALASRRESSSSLDESDIPSSHTRTDAWRYLIQGAKKGLPPHKCVTTQLVYGAHDKK